MNSSNTADKNLPATVEATTHKDPNGTADSGTDARRSPYFRNYREEQERRRRSTDTAETTTLVTRLAGLLWAIVDQAAADRSTRDTDIATEQDADPARFTERTAAKTDFGTRAEPVDGLYGYTPDGDPVVPERGQLMRARTNANGQPADALLEPDAAGDLATWTPGNASSNFVDPTGEQIVGVASGLDESATRTAAPETTAPAAVDDLQAYDRPEEFEDDDTTTGIKTADLEVLTPGGEYVRLGDLLAEPEQFAGTSLESIERSLALEAEKQRVTDGICRSGELSDEIELVGHAKWLNNRFDELAAQRPTTTEIAAARAEAATQARDERLRPLLELDSDTHDEVCKMANRLLSEDFEKVHEVRKQPLTLAIALAERVSRGIEPASALLRQAEAEANNPRNIQTIGNVRYMSTRQTKGRFSTQGRVAILFENTHPGIKQAGVLQDDTGSIRFAIWCKSEWDETRPTPDPTDVGGRTLIRSHRFPELAVGDLVRAENVVKGWYGDEATFETRRDSELTILERAADDSKDDTATSETATTHERRPRQRRRTGPKTTGTPVPKNPIAYWRGSEPSRGILFYGPPGTGKTMFARALAGELDIPFVELGPADVTSKWINEGPQRIRQLFEEAEAVGPCVIFLDEAEHLFGGRDVGTGGAHAEDRKITSELLVHLTAEDRTAIVVGATNRPEDIDPAILRPGRLATHVEIGLPREESRHAIFQSKLRGVPHDLTGDQLAQLASHTAGLSGADIEELVTDAKRRAARRDAQNVSIEDFPSAEGVATERNDTEAEPITDRDLNDSNEVDPFPEDPFDDDPTAGFR